MASLPPTSSPWWRSSHLSGGPVLTAGCRCWWQVLRVRLTLGVAGHEIAVRPDTAPVVHVAGALAVAPRPAERRRQSALLGRGWERPPLSANLDWRRGGWSRTAPSSPPLRGRSHPAIPCGKANGASRRRSDPADAAPPIGHVVRARNEIVSAHVEEHQGAAGDFPEAEDEARAVTPSEGQTLAGCRRDRADLVFEARAHRPGRRSHQATACR